MTRLFYTAVCLSVLIAWVPSSDAGTGVTRRKKPSSSKPTSTIVNGCPVTPGLLNVSPCIWTFDRRYLPSLYDGCNFTLPDSIKNTSTVTCLNSLPNSEYPMLQGLPGGAVTALTAWAMTTTAGIQYIARIDLTFNDDTKTSIGDIFLNSTSTNTTGSPFVSSLSFKPGERIRNMDLTFDPQYGLTLLAISTDAGQTLVRRPTTTIPDQQLTSEDLGSGILVGMLSAVDKQGMIQAVSFMFLDNAAIPPPPRPPNPPPPPPAVASFTDPTKLVAIIVPSVLGGAAFIAILVCLFRCCVTKRQTAGAANAATTSTPPAPSTGRTSSDPEASTLYASPPTATKSETGKANGSGNKASGEPGSGGSGSSSTASPGSYSGISNGTDSSQRFSWQQNTRTGDPSTTIHIGLVGVTTVSGSVHTTVHSTSASKSFQAGTKKDYKAANKHWGRRQAGPANTGRTSGSKTTQGAVSVCAVCCEAEPTYVYTPCGHICVCDSCFPTATRKSCPFCDAPSTDQARIETA